MPVKIFGNNGKNITENIVKPNLEQNMKSLLCRGNRFLATLTQFTVKGHNKLV